MGNSAGGRRFPPEVSGVRASDYDCEEIGGKKHKGIEEKVKCGNGVDNLTGYPHRFHIL